MSIRQMWDPNDPPKLSIMKNLMYGSVFDLFIIIAGFYIIFLRDTLPFLQNSLFLALLLGISLILLGSSLFIGSIMSWKKNDLDHYQEGE